MLETALICDVDGRPIAQSRNTSSRDWAEIEDFTRKAYMKYHVRPVSKQTEPNATMRMASAGRIIATRFAHGVPIRVSDFDPDAGKILVFNNLGGGLRHKGDSCSDLVTGTGESFVVDCSRTDHWLIGDGTHMQLNLTIPHDLMAETAHRWFGFIPDNRLWTTRHSFGGAGSRWHALLDYLVRSFQANGELVNKAVMARHMEELVCLDLLTIWAASARISLCDGARTAAPHYVRRAEEIMESSAKDLPTIGEIAWQVGVCARTLSEGFRRFRGITPRDFLRDRRLEGLHTALQAAQPGQTVTSIAAEWGYTNLGAMGGIYCRRFGEPPSRTLARALGNPKSDSDSD